MSEFNVGEEGRAVSPPSLPTLHIGEQKRLRTAISSRVYQLVPYEIGARSLLFRVLYLALKERFSVESYRYIKQRDLQAALNFINLWGSDIEQKRSEHYESINQ